MGTGRTWNEASSFPSDKTGKNCDFAQVLKRSICLEQNTQAWCDNCEKYQPTVSGRLHWTRVLPCWGLGHGLIWDWLGQHHHPAIYREWEEPQLEDAGPGLTVHVQVSLPVGRLPFLVCFILSDSDPQHLPSPRYSCHQL